ncbi:GNAT family N-acetyltransferase [Oscillospiraceae bacterium OttesenSCG-928-F05]|nr:GNAT family N-acetyltransferase [Oscillospiraceae bacterium OttesenSCG-928-F05]
MIIDVNSQNERDLYQYCISHSGTVPYYYDVNFESWRQSMFSDCDYDGTPLFSELKTMLLMEDGSVKGFIQYGLTNFTIAENGEKDRTKREAVIRNLHYSEQASTARALLEAAEGYFASIDAKRRYAFFHYFGMTCYARQGKLHESGYYMEELLRRFGYHKEHENVYYSILLDRLEIAVPGDITFHYEDGDQSVVFLMEGKKIGGCALYFVPHTEICFLRWIYINKEYSHQGLGTKCMLKLFQELRQKGISRLDTDTADNNVAAQGYYIKTGFQDMGRMRSYHTSQAYDK